MSVLMESTRIAPYHYRVSRLDQDQDRQQHQPLENIKPTDHFNIHFNVILRSGSHLTTLIRSSQDIGCKSFFQDGEDFLRSHLSHPYFPSESLDQITQCVISEVQDMFEFDRDNLVNSDPGRVGRRPKVFQTHVTFLLLLEIVVDLPVDNGDDAVIEESMQEARMIPASKEAIHSLKTFKLPKKCNICMEEFVVGGDDDDDGLAEVSAMPCNHVFHRQCIVRWLQTSHMCPLCRYPMPTADD